MAGFRVAGVSRSAGGAVELEKSARPGAGLHLNSAGGSGVGTDGDSAAVADTYETALRGRGACGSERRCHSASRGSLAAGEGASVSGRQAGDRS